jgi:recombination protein RecA
MAAKRRNLKKLADKVNKELKRKVAKVATEVILSDVQGHLSFGAIALDLAIGGGNLDRMGAPEGRIIEIFGEESTGKSTLGAELMKSAIAAGGDAILIDSEAKWNKQYAEAWGVDLSRVLTLEAHTIEDGFRIIAMVINQCKEEGTNQLPMCVVWDTIAAASTVKEVEAGKYGGGMADKARVLASSVRQLTMACMESRVTLVAINQIIDTLNAYGSPYTTPGGRTIKYGSTTRLEVKRKTKLIEADAAGVKVEIGAEMSVKLVKSPYNQGRTVLIPYFYHKGIDNAQALYRMVWPEMLKAGVATQKSGGWNKVTLPGDKDPISFRLSQIDEIIANEPRFYELMMSTACELLTPPSEKVIPAPLPEALFWATVAGESRETSAAQISELLDEKPEMWDSVWVMPHDKSTGWSKPGDLGFLKS